MDTYKAMSERAKQARRGVIEQRPVSGGKRRPRPYRVFAPSICVGGKPFVIYRGIDYESCQKWIEKARRGMPQASRVWRYWIQGPTE